MAPSKQRPLTGVGGSCSLTGHAGLILFHSFLSLTSLQRSLLLATVLMLFLTSVVTCLLDLARGVGWASMLFATLSIVGLLHLCTIVERLAHVIPTTP